MALLNAFRSSRALLQISWFLIATSSLAAIAVWAYRGHFAVDFGVFWRTAHEPMSLVYKPHAGYPFPYPPSAKLFISPMAFMPLWPAFIAWSSLSAIALWASFRHALGFWPSVMVMITPPVTHGLVTGQSTMFLAAGLLWAVRTDKRIFAGLALGMVASIKPQLVVFLPLLLLLRRDWVAIFGGAAAFLAIIGITTAIYGGGAWTDWLAALPRFRQTLYDLKIAGSVITLPGFADRLGLPLIPFMLIGAALGTYLVVRNANKDFIEVAAALGIASFFVAPYALGYDFILAAPYLVREIFRRNLLPTIALAGAPNPLPLLLSAATLLGARFDVEELSRRAREREAIKEVE